MGALDIVTHSRLFGHEIKQAWLQWLQIYDASRIREALVLRESYGKRVERTS